MVTVAQIVALAPSADPALAAALAPELTSQLQEAGMATQLRTAHFMAQVCVESANFTALKEKLSYSSADRIAHNWPKLKDRAATLLHNPVALGNAAYANILGNGSEASGDGYLFRGRGLIQLTGRANYAGASADLDIDLVSNPDAAAEPPTAVKTAIWFFSKHGCLHLADLDQADAITLKVHGSLGDQGPIRRALALKAKGIFSDLPEAPSA